MNKRGSIEWIIGLQEAKAMSGELANKYPFNEELSANLQDIERKINNFLIVFCDRVTKDTRRN